MMKIDGMKRITMVLYDYFFRKIKKIKNLKVIMKIDRMKRITMVFSFSVWILDSKNRLIIVLYSPWLLLLRQSDINPPSYLSNRIVLSQNYGLTKNYHISTYILNSLRYFLDRNRMFIRVYMLPMSMCIICSWIEQLVGSLKGAKGKGGAWGRRQLT